VENLIEEKRRPIYKVFKLGPEFEAPQFLCIGGGGGGEKRRRRRRRRRRKGRRRGMRQRPIAVVTYKGTAVYAERFHVFI
jgi:hypothetical protein